MYDSRFDTLLHILAVRSYLMEVMLHLGVRSSHHDESKLESPEKGMYDKYTPLLKGLTYGSDEYKRCLKEMGFGLQHHYEHNRHHPEHHADGVDGMSLLDLMEMLADWAAAVKRHADGDLMESLSINAERFGISDQLARILENTVREMGWYGP